MRIRPNCPAVKKKSGLAKTARARIVPAPRSTWLSTKVELALARPVRLVGEMQRDGDWRCRASTAACRWRWRADRRGSPPSLMSK